MDGRKKGRKARRKDENKKEGRKECEEPKRTSTESKNSRQKGLR